MVHTKLLFPLARAARDLRRFIPEAGAVALLGAIGLSLAAAGWSQEIPKSYWGIHTNQPTSFPVQVPYGQWRGWDTGAQWQNMSKCPGSSSKCQSNPSQSTVEWGRFDTYMADLKQAGVDDVFYTLNRTPQWATPQPNDTNCNYGTGSCWPPVDLNPDGSGSDAIWKDWVTRIATRVNDPGYRKSHAHIKYWEPWNEWFVNANFGWGPRVQAHLTYAAMLRLTEDLRCTITGKGTIHNFPKAGQETPCSAKAIDPDALISTPSDSPDCCQVLMQNFLYCNNHEHLNDMGGDSTCTWNGKNWGSDAVDLINFHFYTHSVQQGPPETIIPKVNKIRSWLNDTDRAKPLINSEGSSGILNGPNTLWNDDYSRMGLIPRFYALYWSVGISMNVWFAYDMSAALWTPGGDLTPAGKSWTTAYNWLEGSTPTTTPFCTNRGTLYTCSLRKANGQVAQLVWEARHGPGGSRGPADCTAAAAPTICGDATYNVPAQYGQDWVDVTGAVHPFQKTVTIGAVPILLEGAAH
jgi:hypothetical protein